MLLYISLIAAVASIIGAIFAVWRWSYAIKAYKLQELQVIVQIVMLMESREYWKKPKMKYVQDKKNHKFYPSLRQVLRETRKRGLDVELPEKDFV